MGIQKRDNKKERNKGKLLEKLKGKRLRTIVMTLAVFVVFVTTYLLVLPAITIEKDVAEQLPGISLSGSSENVSDDTDESGENEEEIEIEDQDVPGAAFSGKDSEKGDSSVETDDSSKESKKDNSKDSDNSKEDSNVPSEDDEADSNDDSDGDGSKDKDRTSDSDDISQDEDKDEDDAGSDDEDSQEDEIEKYINEPTTFTWKGKDYTVTAVVDEYCLLPENVELKVKEIRKDGGDGTKKEVKKEKKDYERYYNAAAEEINRIDGSEEGREKKLSYARFFDISFVADGQEIEPASPVEVNIALKQSKKSQKDALEGTDNRTLKDDQNLRVLHFEENEGDLGHSDNSDGSGKGKDKKDKTDEDNKELFPEEIANGVSLDKKDKDIDVSFTAETFSVYGVVYTVDFAYEVDGETYEYSMSGGGYISLTDIVKKLKIAKNEDMTVTEFIADVENVEFSDPDLVWVGKVEEDTTVGGLKEDNGLEVQYSSDLTDDDIKEINSSAVKAGDWALISLQPFDTEETLTVTMKNGDVWSISVTDAYEVEEFNQLDTNNSYIIAYESGGIYYVLKTDGTTEAMSKSTTNLDKLGDEYRWTFYYVFTEKDRDTTLDYVYYFVRPVANKSVSLALYEEGISLVESGANNIAIHPQDGGGFVFEGYENNGGNEVYLYYDSDAAALSASKDESSILHLYEQEPLEKYDYQVITEGMDKYGTVAVTGGMAVTVARDPSDNTQGTYTYYIAETDANKTNTSNIVATAVTHRDSQNKNKWIFDYFDLDGEVVSSDLVTLNNTTEPTVATIAPNALTIGQNRSVLTAHFKQNSAYTVPDSEKEGTSFSDMAAWLKELTSRNIPLNEDGCKKTAEVYDYENRIYRVDLTAQSSLSTFDGSIDLAFMIDVSASMKFPADLYESNDVAGHAAKKISTINSNNNWQSWGLKSNKVYYIITDESSTATVCRLYYSGGEWKIHDASKDQTSTFTITNDNLTYYKAANSYVIMEAGDLVTQDDLDDPTTKTLLTKLGIATVGTPKTRAFYLESSLAATVNSLKSILNTLNVAGAQSPDVNIAWNTFCKTVKSHEDFRSAKTGTIEPTYAYDGGTRTDLALQDAVNFRTWSSTTKYAVLITDGMPQNNGVGIASDTKTAATTLKNGADGTANTTDDISLITVGLSMGDIVSGKALLYDIADTVKDEKAFYLAESDQLEDILLHILQLMMNDATVQGTIKDQIAQAFYPVDKATGQALTAGKLIDLNGNLTTDTSQPYGTITYDSDTDTYGVTWSHHDISWDGWHGTVYIKAKEDLLGGNALLTNSGNATIKAESYTLIEGGTEFTLASEDSVSNTHYSLTQSLSSPRVNVNELGFDGNTTEWTVYLGTDVDPKQQLQKLYESIQVEEVVTEGKDTNGDTYKLPDTIKYTDGSSHYYPLAENDITDNRESQAAENAEKQTFKLADLILELLNNTENAALKAKYIKDDKLDWDAFIEDALTRDGITIPYHVYSIESTDGGNINIKLSKTIVEGEQILDGQEDVTLQTSPHTASVVGDEVEAYTLTVLYSPDYTVLTKGQGGSSTEDFQTGTYGTIYQGHAAGTEKSTNTHVINVYAQPLEVLKTDAEDGSSLSGAVFSLYRAATEEEINNNQGVSLTDYDADMTGKYILVSQAETDENGIAKLASASDGTTVSGSALVSGVTYYLIETTAPTKTSDGKNITYEKDREIRTVTVDTQDGVYTDLDGASISAKTYPFNWDQGARILVDGDPVSVIESAESESEAESEAEGDSGDSQTSSTETITDGSYVSGSQAVSFRTTIKNTPNVTELTVKKSWKGTENPPESITFNLYRTVYIDHDWSDGVVTINGDVTDETCVPGSTTTYTCHICGKTKTETTEGSDHDWDDGVVTKEATCADTGIKTYTCKNDFSHTKTEVIPATDQHKAGDSVIENLVEATYDSAGSYDLVTYCSVCGEELSRETVTIPKLVKYTKITYRTYGFWYSYGDTYYYLGQGSKYQRTSVTSDDSYEVGSQITISWSDSYDYYPSARIYQDNEPSVYYSKRNGGYYYYAYPSSESGSTSVTRSGSNGNYTYSGTFTVTDGMTLDVWLGYYYYTNPSNFRITGTSVQSTSSAQSLLAATGDPLQSSTTATHLMGLVSTSEPIVSTPLSAGSATVLSAASEDAGETGTSESEMTSDQLQTLLDSFVTVTERQENQDCVTVKELVGIYTITADGNWTWSSADVDGLNLLRYDSDGREYTYYVQETDPSSGYVTTYTGQDEGLKDGDTATIINELASFPIYIKKYIEGTTTPLAGASFTLTQVDENGNEVTDGIEQTQGPTGEDGSLTFTDIMPGRYKLEETKVPDGYNKTEGPYYINVTSTDEDTVDDTFSYITAKTGHTFEIENTPGAALPNAGGIGTNLIYLLGTMLTLFAGIGLVLKRRYSIR